MVKFLLRINKDTYEKLKQIAKNEDRSVNSLINHLIKKQIERG